MEQCIFTYLVQQSITVSFKGEKMIVYKLHSTFVIYEMIQLKG